MAEKLAYTIAEACAAAGIGRTTLYQHIRNGHLRTFKIGRRTLIRTEELARWVENLAVQNAAQA
jgi:excisionase family DNA binding protein